MNTTIPIILMSLLNAWTSIGLIFEKNYPMALVFACYCVATLGLLWAVKSV